MIKYTKEQEEFMYDAYSRADSAEQREHVVLSLVNKFNKPKRSIIAKLSKMGIYISKAKISKVLGSKPQTKEQLVTKIEQRFGVEPDEFMGLEKAPKLVLIALLTKNPSAA